MVQALDLRVRIAVLPGTDAADLAHNDVLQAALGLLLKHPETAAIAVVSDDNDLTTRIFEPFDSPRTVIAHEVAQVPEDPLFGPLGNVIRSYLRQVNPGWDPPPLVDETSLRFDDAAFDVARATLATLKKRRKHNPESAAARSGLSTEDAAWVARLSVQVLEGSTLPAKDALTRRARSQVDS
jgi:hypothetical protein